MIRGVLKCSRADQEKVCYDVILSDFGKSRVEIFSYIQPTSQVQYFNNDTKNTILGKWAWPILILVFIVRKTE